MKNKMIMCSFRWSRTFVVLQMTPTLFNPCECLSTNFTNEAFDITVLSFMGVQVSWVWIFVGGLVTFMFGFTMIK